jgi:hypothetical protein
MNQASDNGFVIVMITVAFTLVAVTVSVYMGNKHLQDVRSQDTPAPITEVAP